MSPSRPRAASASLFHNAFSVEGFDAMSKAVNELIAKLAPR
jgi:hypothetical protein